MKIDVFEQTISLRVSMLQEAAAAIKLEGEKAEVFSNWERQAENAAADIDAVIMQIIKGSIPCDFDFMVSDRIGKILNAFFEMEKLSGF